MVAAGADFISIMAYGARHRYRFDHGLQGLGDLDVDVPIRLKLVQGKVTQLKGAEAIDSA